MRIARSRNVFRPLVQSVGKRRSDPELAFPPRTDARGCPSLVAAMKGVTIWPADPQKFAEVRHEALPRVMRFGPQTCSRGQGASVWWTVAQLRRFSECFLSLHLFCFCQSPARCHPL